MPSSKLKCGKKLRNMSPSRFVSTTLHKSLIEAKYVEYCMKILSVCSGQSNACIQNQDFGDTLAIFLLLKWLKISKALIWHKAEKIICLQEVWQHSSAVRDKENRVFC